MAVDQSSPDLLSTDIPLPQSGLGRLMWTAGFLDGEGSFGFYGNMIQVVGVQVERQPLEWLLTMFGGRINRHQRAKPRPRVSESWVWIATGPRAAGIMMTLYAFLSQKRQTQIRTALATWRVRPIYTGARAQCLRGHSFQWKVTASDPRGKRRFCYTCIDIYRTTPEYRKKARERQAAYRTDPTFRERQREYRKLYDRRPERMVANRERKRRRRALLKVQPSQLTLPT
jgi:hypothetical protein